MIIVLPPPALHLFFLSLSLPKAILTEPRKLLNPELSNETKGVTTQMKALDEYFQMVVFTFLLNS